MIKDFLNFSLNSSLKSASYKIACLIIFSTLCFGFRVLASNPFLKENQSSTSTSVSAEKAVLIILDASGSMGENAGSYESKMFAAKEALEKVLREVDSSYLVGLRVYGSSDPNLNEYLDCQDTHLLVPPQPYNRALIVNQLRKIKPRGQSPIGYAMRQAIQDLAPIRAKEKKIILISDGQDTCGYDPCSFSRSLAENNLDFKMDVVGFGGIDLSAQVQLKCIAHNLDGNFYSADNPEQLKQSLIEEIDYQHQVESSIYESLD